MISFDIKKIEMKYGDLKMKNKYLSNLLNLLTLFIGLIGILIIFVVELFFNFFWASTQFYFTFFKHNLIELKSNFYDIKDFFKDNWKK